MSTPSDFTIDIRLSNKELAPLARALNNADLRPLRDWLGTEELDAFETACNKIKHAQFHAQNLGAACLFPGMHE